MVRAGGQVTIVPRRTSVVAEGENGEGSSSSSSNGASSSHDAAGVTLDIVRLPASQLRFFPGQRREPSGRHGSRSLDNEVGRSADSVRAMSATERAARRQRARTHGGTFSPDDPLPPAGKSTKRVVRLRPPRELAPAPDAGEQSLATRLSMLFSVAPPPAHPAAVATASSPRVSSTGGSRPTSGASTPSYHPQAAAAAVELEMDARAVPRRTDVRPEDLRRMASAGGHIKPRRPTDKKRD